MTAPLHSRDDWGARPARSTPGKIDNEGQTLHYGGGSPWGASADRSSAEAFARTTDHARCATILRGWQAFHQDGRGWADLAYSSAVCPHGHRYDGRGVSRRSAANGTNAGNARSCATVYIAGASDPVTDDAKRAFHDEAKRFGVTLRWNHSDWKSTACAGDPIRAWQAAGFPLPDQPPHPAPIPEDLMSLTQDIDALVAAHYAAVGRSKDKTGQAYWVAMLAVADTRNRRVEVLNSMRSGLGMSGKIA